MANKRYALFGWYPHEGSGGWNDFRGTFADVQDALSKIETENKDPLTEGRIWQIVDLVDEEIIFQD